jgi:hypothetical protein
MAKGISSGQSLKRLVHMLNQFVLSWSEGNLRRNNGAGASDWPAPYKLAAIKGEAVLRQQFFESFIPRLPYTATADQQLQLWESLVNQSGALADFMNRIGIKSALRREAHIPNQTERETRILYCILCQALVESNAELQNNLLIVAVDQFMLHQWKQQFPTQNVATKKSKHTPEQLRETLETHLRKQHKTPVEIRESFTQTEAGEVHFKLLTRNGKSEPWEELVAATRPRVSTARNAAFATALKGHQGE